MKIEHNDLKCWLRQLHLDVEVKGDSDIYYLYQEGLISKGKFLEVIVNAVQDYHDKKVKETITCKHGIILYGGRCLNCEREATSTTGGNNE